MSQEHRRQKKLAKHKKNRQIAQQKARSTVRREASHDSTKHLLSLAPTLPFGPAYISADWEMVSPPTLVTCVVTRQLPDGRLLPGTALVDRTCLGVKGGLAMPPMLHGELIDHLNQSGALAVLRLRPCEPLLVQSVVFHALDYADSLGFKPDKEFPPELFGPRPAVLLDTPLARPQKPLYMSGPSDQVRRVLAQLEAKVGTGNYDVVVAPSQLGDLAAFPGLASTVRTIHEDDEPIDDDDDLIVA